ncbi:hypothetical protein MJO28_002921 [Puccinia striiformis f. sp. tritici]|uniref:Uncharacterized protein n=2 Tax=Puccinia striiformis TaxID=27350 RepID=A0A2S4UJH0_9BASI|nr:hypothetical protein MJO28_002921 [Puccinia striiformis f. sp. tritici]POV97473.1 hypothetical protein PSTT_15040 [Puccinia striiformis]
MTSNPDPDEVPLGDTSTTMTTDSEGSPDEVPVSDTSSTMVADDAETDADDDPERMAEMESLVCFYCPHGSPDPATLAHHTCSPKAAAIVAIASTPEEVDSQYSSLALYVEQS